jgi:hypothetical protein
LKFPRQNAVKPTVPELSGVSLFRE